MKGAPTVAVLPILFEDKYAVAYAACVGAQHIMHESVNTSDKPDIMPRTVFVPCLVKSPVARCAITRASFRNNGTLAPIATKLVNKRSER